MDARQDLAALPRQQRPYLRELGRANDTGADGLALEPLHEESVAQTVRGGEHVHDLGLGDARVSCAAH